MTHTYKVSGMTCQHCRASVEESLKDLEHVKSVSVDLEAEEAKIDMEKHMDLETLQKALSDKYTISKKSDFADKSGENIQDQSKAQQLFPLFLIFGYITAASILLNFSDWELSSFMFDFMGLFYIVFSFFKFLDYTGFPESFRMYDPLAKVLPAYGWVYPFLETALGLMFLMRFEIDIALVATIVVLGITTIGVTRSLFSKKVIKCACLGTALNLPMTEATFIENTIMLVMAVWMLLF
ncbi:cation transporter [Psychroflexus sp. CAK57W]|uniref:heavy-metal-associated domain-containing protein n=1 Tax=Psychroflexus curvus TaxID=2873595 RepID=UPI001CCFA396|nr:heavy metal-associated domain-containing protein [Psychroflexus curvus]MBZ9628733.1 cation transporter [Psychroflexus curvus]MBZ9786817.1 cation transporter [Psychroflexus curvus]